MEKFAIVLPRGFLIFLALFVLFGSFISASSPALILFTILALPLSVYLSFKIYEFFKDPELEDLDGEEDTEEEHLGKIIPLFKKDDSFSRVFEYRVDRLDKNDFEE